MQTALIALIGAGILPLSVAIWSNRRTSLLHALVWAMIAWLCWGLAFYLDNQPARYCTLCLTGCAGVAVLGARRPYVVAWDFVVLSLFVVMTLPLVETAIIGTNSLDGMRIVFLAGAIGVGVFNYVPTGTGLVALHLAIVLACEIVTLFAPAFEVKLDLYLDFQLTMAPWLAWLFLFVIKRANRSKFDRLWLDFRDGWGFVWGQRVREQFNQAAKNAGWPVALAWSGLKPDSGDEQYVVTLRAVLQRFVDTDQNL